MAYATKRLTREEALKELRDVLSTVPEHERQMALNNAASTYAGPGYWHEDAFEVLLTAGADREAAEAIRAQPRGGNLGGLGEQG